MINETTLRQAQKIDHKLDTKTDNLYLLYFAPSGEYGQNESWAVYTTAGNYAELVAEFDNLAELAATSNEEISAALSVESETNHQHERTLADDVLFDTTNQIMGDATRQNFFRIAPDLNNYEYRLGYQLRQDIWAVTYNNNNDDVEQCFVTLWELECDEYYGLYIAWQEHCPQCDKVTGFRFDDEAEVWKCENCCNLSRDLSNG